MAVSCLDQVDACDQESQRLSHHLPSQLLLTSVRLHQLVHVTTVNACKLCGAAMPDGAAPGSHSAERCEYPTKQELEMAANGVHSAKPAPGCRMSASRKTKLKPCVGKGDLKHNHTCTLLGPLGWGLPTSHLRIQGNIFRPRPPGGALVAVRRAIVRACAQPCLQRGQHRGQRRPLSAVATTHGVTHLVELR